MSEIVQLKAGMKIWGFCQFIKVLEVKPNTDEILKSAVVKFDYGYILDLPVCVDEAKRSEYVCFAGRNYYAIDAEVVA